MDRSDLAVLASIERDVLQPDVIAATLRKTLERLKPQAAAAQGARQEVEKRLQTVERDLERLTAAITAGGQLSTIVLAIKERETARDQLRLDLRSIDRAGKAATVDLPTVERDLRTTLDEWKVLLRKHVPQARARGRPRHGSRVFATDRLPWAFALDGSPTGFPRFSRSQCKGARGNPKYRHCPWGDRWVRRLIIAVGHMRLWA